MEDMMQEAMVAAVSRKRILVVEDEPEVRAVLVRALRSMYDVYEAPHGLAALSMLESMPRPDLVISDVSMPHVSGLTMAIHMKKAGFKDIPIIFLTARDSFADVVAGINAGARHYVTKPFGLDDLRGRVEHVLKGH